MHMCDCICVFMHIVVCMWVCIRVCVCVGVCCMCAHANDYVCVCAVFTNRWGRISIFPKYARVCVSRVCICMRARVLCVRSCVRAQCVQTKETRISVSPQHGNYDVTSHARANMQKTRVMAITATTAPFPAAAKARRPTRVIQPELFSRTQISIVNKTSAWLS